MSIGVVGSLSYINLPYASLVTDLVGALICTTLPTFFSVKQYFEQSQLAKDQLWRSATNTLIGSWIAGSAEAGLRVRMRCPYDRWDTRLSCVKAPLNRIPRDFDKLDPLDRVAQIDVAFSRKIELESERGIIFVIDSKTQTLDGICLTVSAIPKEKASPPSSKYFDFGSFGGGSGRGGRPSRRRFAHGLGRVPVAG